MEKRYRINEIFYSLQGEGVRAGTAAVFVRFSRCNLECRVEPGEKSPGGFDCDTEFESGRWLTAREIHEEARFKTPIGQVRERQDWMILTGGEPALQVDLGLCEELRGHGWLLAIETNGSILLPVELESEAGVLGSGPSATTKNPRALTDELARFPFDWITVSPKVAEHAIRQRWAHEVKYVRGDGQLVPETRVLALYKVLSPAFAGLEVDPAAVATCVELVKANPEWRLSVQQHKLWRVR